MHNFNDYQRYLAAKKSVDDRALNQLVWNAMVEELHGTKRSEPLQVVELGAGIGTMVERMLERTALPDCTYTAVDALAANSAAVKQRLTTWADERRVTHQQLERRLVLYPPGFSGKSRVRIEVESAVLDVFEFLSQTANQKRFDLVVANAFLDLVDAANVVQRIASVLKPEGLLYTSINFDSGTILQPEIDSAFDKQVEQLYHQTMDQREVNGKRAGESRTGRRLFGYLREAGFHTVAAGASDWVVFAEADRNSRSNGKEDDRVYTKDEAYFLHFIIETIKRALTGNPSLEQHRFQQWIERRHLQIDKGDLVYIAHQLDFLALRP